MQTRIQGWMAQARWLAPLAALTMWGCPNQELAPLEPCTVSGVNLDAAGDGVDKVDVLFMIDNSGSMAEEQAKLGAKLNDLVGVLTSGNKDYPNPPAADGTRSFTPAKSLHIGVVTSNMGAPMGVAATASPACGPDNGESGGGGGILQGTGLIASKAQINANTGKPVKDAVAACQPVNLSPPYLAFGGAMGEIPTNNPQSLQNGIFQFGCIATVGVAGCGIEQQLEASWKAVASSQVNDFYGPRTTGNGDGPNRGFARPDSVLAIVMVSDEDDCSVTPQGTLMFEKGTPQGTPPVQVRCQLLKDNPAYASMIRPISRYADGFVGLRQTYPERIVFAAIVGLPQAGVDYTDASAVLNHPQMVVQLDANAKTPDLNGVCGSDEGDGKAYPGRRFVELAKAIQDKRGSFVLRSICDTDYKPALDLIIDKIAQQLTGACLPRPLQKNSADGLVTCDVVEILGKDPVSGADLGTCDPALGRERIPEGRLVEGKTRTACKVKQLKAGPNGTDPGGNGWYYDEESAELKKTKGCERGQRVVFTATAQLQAGALARVECFQPQPRITEKTMGFAAINTSCATDENLCTSISLPKETMLCERTSRSCQIACSTSANCPEGWLCASPSTSDPKFCQNPTCSVTGT